MESAGEKPPPRGFEPLAESSEVSQIAQVTDSQESCLPTGLPNSAQFRAELNHLIAIWPRLSESVRHAILTLAETTLNLLSPDALASSESNPATDSTAPRRGPGASCILVEGTR